VDQTEPKVANPNISAVSETTPEINVSEPGKAPPQSKTEGLNPQQSMSKTEDVASTHSERIDAEFVYNAAEPLGKTARLGLRKPKGVKFASFPEKLQYQPEFVTSEHLVHIFDLGEEPFLLLDSKRFDALSVWNSVAKQMGLRDAVLFLWSPQKCEFLIVPVSSLTKSVSTGADGDRLVAEVQRRGGLLFDWDKLRREAIRTGAYET